MTADQPAEATQPRPAAFTCEHHYAVRRKSGEPIQVRACAWCREPDWDDLRAQVTDLRPAVVVPQREDEDEDEVERLAEAARDAYGNHPATTWPETGEVDADSPLTPEERQSMTIWGKAISAQIRDYSTLQPGTLEVGGTKRVLVLHVMDDAYREQGDVHIPAGDLDKLRALLNEAVTRA